MPRLIAVSLGVGACIDMFQRDFASLRKKIITIDFDWKGSNLTLSSSQYIPSISSFSTMFLPVALAGLALGTLSWNVIFLP